jgi:hypothetical protein
MITTGIAALGAALIGAGSAHADAAPFEDLFGTAGINTWTAGADAWLIGNDPTLAASLDSSVENFMAVAQPPYFYGLDTWFSDFTAGSDPGAFANALVSGNTEFLIPMDFNGDVALGLDYSLFTLAPGLEPGFYQAYEALGAPLAVLGSLVFWGELFLSPILGPLLGGIPAAAADAPTIELTPVEDLYGGAATDWTGQVDALLNTVNPSLAASLESGLSAYGLLDDDPFSDLVASFDPAGVANPNDLLSVLASTIDFGTFDVSPVAGAGGEALDKVVDLLLGSV